MPGSRKRARLNCTLLSFRLEWRNLGFVGLTGIDGEMLRQAQHDIDSGSA